MNKSGLSIGVGRLVGRARAAAALAALLSLVGAAVGGGLGVQNAAPASRAVEPPKADALDTIIFKDGRVVKGTVVSQNDTSVTVKGEVSGIAFQTEYSRADILSIRLAEKPAVDPKAAPAKPDPKAAAKPAPKAVVESGDANAKKIYVMELSGKFARDTSQTPIREAASDAKKNGADVIVVIVENEWVRSGDGEEQKADDATAFDELFRVEDMDQIFNDEIPRWEKPPRVVFWVKRAMGGPAFLTLSSPEIYFHSEGRMGGIGWINQAMGDIGDVVVKNKLIAARIGHAEGIAARSGYPTQIVRAMAITEYELSVSFDGGTPLFYERLPQDDTEVLLTDNGGGDNRDTGQKMAAGEGNDVLTLNAKIAKDLRISRGTVDTLDDLIFELGLAHNSVIVKGRSDQIMKGWRDGVDKAERDVRRLIDDLSLPQPTGTFEERTRARARIKRILDDIKKVLARYAEAFGRAEINRINAILTDNQNVITHQQQEDAMAQRKRK